MSSQGAANTAASDDCYCEHQKAQRTLAYVVFVFAFLLLSVVALVAISDGREERTELVFTTVTTLVGTWVGTLLAFYFSRENFESASRSMQQAIRQLTPDERLHTLPILTTMLRRDEITPFELTAGQTPADVPLTDFVTKFASDEKVTRLPILNPDGSLFGILHESELNKFLQNNKSDTPLTLGQLIADPEAGRKLKLFGLVGITRTLRDAKLAMEAQKGCRDVFVTETGEAKEKVLGWITNVGILAALDA